MQEIKRNFNVHNGTYLEHYRSHLLVEMELLGSMISFLKIVFVIFLFLHHRRIIYTALMA